MFDYKGLIAIPIFFGILMVILLVAIFGIIFVNGKKAQLRLQSEDNPKDDQPINNKKVVENKTGGVAFFYFFALMMAFCLSAVACLFIWFFGDFWIVLQASALFGLLNYSILSESAVLLGKHKSKLFFLVFILTMNIVLPASLGLLHGYLINLRIEKEQAADDAQLNFLQTTTDAAVGQMNPGLCDQLGSMSVYAGDHSLSKKDCQDAVESTTTYWVLQQESAAVRNRDYNGCGVLVDKLKGKIFQKIDPTAILDDCYKKIDQYQKLDFNNYSSGDFFAPSLCADFVNKTIQPTNQRKTDLINQCQAVMTGKQTKDAAAVVATRQQQNVKSMEDDIGTLEMNGVNNIILKDCQDILTYKAKFPAQADEIQGEYKTCTNFIKDSCQEARDAVKGNSYSGYADGVKEAKDIVQRCSSQGI